MESFLEYYLNESWKLEEDSRIHKEGIKHEIKSAQSIKRYILELGETHNNRKYIPLKRNDEKIVYIVNAIRLKKIDKADIVLYGYETKEDIGYDKKSIPLVWISIKKGKNMSDFQQYGGISKDFLKKVKNLKKEDKDCIEKFVSQISKIYNKTKENSKNFINYFSTEITDHVKQISMYGYDFGSKEYGKNNVNFLLQGDISLIKNEKENCFEFSAAHLCKNPEIPIGGADPRFCSRKSKDRNDYGLHETRLGVYPSDFKKNTAVDLNLI